MLEIICDFCGEKITTKQNKGGEVKSFRLEENICDECKRADLNKRWDSNKEKLDEEWLVVENEKKNFFKNLLNKQKKDWKEKKRKDFFGNFFVEEVK